MLNRLNGKLIKTIGIVGGIILLIIIILSFLLGGGVVPYSKIEDRMVRAAIAYYEDNEELLPKNNGDKATVSGLDLETGYMKSVSKMVDKSVTCNSEVRVYKFNDQLNYVPYLNCGNDYKTIELYKELTKDSNVVTTGSGLYKIGNEYAYRGFEVNNYVNFDGKIWRIVSINESGDVKIINTESKTDEIWDNSYNIEKNWNAGINLFYNSKTEPSKIYTYLTELINNDKFISKEATAKLAYIDTCYAPRSKDANGSDGSIECALKTKMPVTMISVNEYIRASLDANCLSVGTNSCFNFNYLTDFSGKFWTVTPVGGTTYKVYAIAGYTSESEAASYNKVREVISLNSSNVYLSGDGSLNNPYKIK